MISKCNFTAGLVLFYCTFVAFKRQDKTTALHSYLREESELIGEEGELDEFGGEIFDDDMRHALWLFRDQASGVVRLEASALRGDMQGVPIWTAFVTKYATDPDVMHYDGEGVVSFIAMDPPPYVFLAGYTPPRDKKGQLILRFVADSGKSANSHLTLS